MRRLNVAIVDWSAASTPSPARPSADAIWIGTCVDGTVETRYFRTRQAAETALHDLIATGDWLVGCDFAFGYPTGFAERLTGTPEAPAVWQWFEREITDSPANANNRFAVAAGINRRLGPLFWGRPAGLDLPDLPPRKPTRYADLGLAERRRVERDLRGTHPVWKLYTTGAVGSQVMMGLPMIARLARQPGVSVWPFQPPARVTLAEVWPSLLAAAVARQLPAFGGIRDAAQVALLSRALWRLGAEGRLDPLLAPPPGDTPADEGWILGAGHSTTLSEACQ